MPIPSVRVRATLAGVAALGLAGAGLAAALSAPAANATAPTAYAISGVDTSYSNHDHRQAIDWNQVRAAGNVFMFAKATEGMDVTDSWFARDLQGAARAGLMRAPYHFYGRTPGLAQAQNFVRVVTAAGYTGTHPGELPPVLDLERKGNGDCPTNFDTGQVSAFLAEVQRRLHLKPIIYTSEPFIKKCMHGRAAMFSGHVLWQPRYDSGTREPADLPGAGRSWDIWQYTEDGTVPGIPSHSVDRNVFRGSLAALRSLAHLSGTVSVPGRTAVSGTSVLTRGSHGTDVATAQLLLNAHGQRLQADGVFGAGTAAAVKAFQSTHHLTPDGLIGPNTWRALLVTVKSGSRGAAVRALQLQLARRSARLGADGVFGPGTAAAVKAFQSTHHLTPDGVAGPKTWSALLAR